MPKTSLHDIGISCYDNNGSMHTKTDARNITSSYLYDALNQSTQISYGGGDIGGLPRLGHGTFGCLNIHERRSIFNGMADILAPVTTFGNILLPSLSPTYSRVFALSSSTPFPPCYAPIDFRRHPMTSREARTQRRAAERKAKKAEYKRNQAAALRATEPTLEEEFSPELMAEANAARERIHCAAGLQPLDRVAGLPPLDRAVGRQSLDRAKINRENAAHSTGPRSVEGKKDEAAHFSEPKTQTRCSSRNSLQHGLASGQIIIPGEDPSQFEALLNDLLAEHQPSTSTEELLVREMAQSYWLTQRALRLQNDCFNRDGVDEKRLSLFLRYQTTHERAFHKALTALMKLQKQRAHGFVSQSAARPTPNAGFVSHSAPNSAAAFPEQHSENHFDRQSGHSQAA